MTSLNHEIVNGALVLKPSRRIDSSSAKAFEDDAAALLDKGPKKVVIDATDNFPTRFLLADAAHLAGVPIVHAAAVRWQATVLGAAGHGKPCYRCLFEDVPSGALLDCATAGVAGPVCGVAGAVAADRAIRSLEGDRTAVGTIVTYDGLTDRLRQIEVHPRANCALCGAEATIGTIDARRYTNAVTCE